MSWLGNRWRSNPFLSHLSFIPMKDNSIFYRTGHPRLASRFSDWGYTWMIQFFNRNIKKGRVQPAHLSVKISTTNLQFSSGSFWLKYVIWMNACSLWILNLSLFALSFQFCLPRTLYMKEFFMSPWAKEWQMIQYFLISHTRHPSQRREIILRWVFQKWNGPTANLMKCF